MLEPRAGIEPAFPRYECGVLTDWTTEAWSLHPDLSRDFHVTKVAGYRYPIEASNEEL